VNTEKSIKKKQDEYYDKNSKNVFFKKEQKYQMAEIVQNNFTLTELLESTVYSINGSRLIFFNYLLFKTYAHPGIYQFVIDHILSVFSKAIERYGLFEVHFNLDTFSMSAAHRYNDIIKMFCSQCLQAPTKYSAHLDKLHIYNTPNMIQSISKLFNPMINENVKRRITLVSKEESASLLSSLLNL
jgi:hypothetical protein